jgi:citrate lyase subunit beta/citryl-CoA lyase
MKLRRTMLFVPGTQEPAQIRTTLQSCGADLVCLDLEDTVVPARKPAARTIIAGLLTENIWGRSDRAVRINAVSTRFAEDDIIEVLAGAHGRVDVLVLSKVESADEVRWIDSVVERVRRDTGFDHPIRYSAGIETARALTDIDAIAASSPNLESLGFAIGDLSNALGINVGAFLQDRSLYPGDLFHFVRSRIVLAARTRGLMVLDGPWPIINDHATLAEDARWGMMLGFDGKVVLSAGQIPIVHQAYRPSDAEIARFTRILETYERGVAEGAGSGMMDGEFFDQVTVGQARACLARAAAPI